MEKPRVGIIISTIREGRFGDRPAQWIHDIATTRTDFDCEIVDLRAYPIPHFEETASPIARPPKNDVATQWCEKVSSFDGYIFVTAEYNHSIPGVLKNALDHAYPEFNRKPAAFVGYGGVGGARAVEHLRLICVELQMAPMRAAVHIGTEPYRAVAREGKALSDFPYLKERATEMLDELAWWTRTLRAGRGNSGDAELEQAAPSVDGAGS